MLLQQWFLIICYLPVSPKTFSLFLIYLFLLAYSRYYLENIIYIPDSSFFSKYESKNWKK